jgi:hypothetical protein
MALTANSEKRSTVGFSIGLATVTLKMPQSLNKKLGCVDITI